MLFALDAGLNSDMEFKILTNGVETPQGNIGTFPTALDPKVQLISGIT